MSLMILYELKDDKYEEKGKNGEKSSKWFDDRKVVEKHRHISRSTRSRFSCLIYVQLHGIAYGRSMLYSL